MLRGAKLTSRIGKSFMLGIAQKGISMIRKSSASRSSELRSARIELLGGPGGTDCIVRSLTDVQAVLEVRHPHELPLEFDLLVEPEQKRQRCGIIRRQALSVAVAFI